MTIKKILTIIQFRYIVFRRYRTVTSNLELYLRQYGISYPADWFAVLLISLLLTTAFIGISAESPQRIDNQLFPNIVYLACYLIIIQMIETIWFATYVDNSINRILKNIPISPIQTYFILFITEFFSHKILIPLIILIMLPYFMESYSINYSIGKLIVIYFWLLSIYFISIYLGRILRKLFNLTKFKNHENKIYNVATLFFLMLAFTFEEINIYMASHSLSLNTVTTSILTFLFIVSLTDFLIEIN